MWLRHHARCARMSLRRNLRFANAALWLRHHARCARMSLRRNLRFANAALWLRHHAITRAARA